MSMFIIMSMFIMSMYIMCMFIMSNEHVHNVHTHNERMCRTINGLRESLSSDEITDPRLSLDPLLVDKVSEVVCL